MTCSFDIWKQSYFFNCVKYVSFYKLTRTQADRFCSERVFLYRKQRIMEFPSFINVLLLPLYYGTRKNKVTRVQDNSKNVTNLPGDALETWWEASVSSWSRIRSHFCIKSIWGLIHGFVFTALLPTRPPWSYIFYTDYSPLQVFSSCSRPTSQWSLIWLE